MSKTTFLPFARPTISEKAIAEVVDCIRSGWIATGPRVAAFEQMLGDYHGNRQARCTSSATAGLQLALEAIGLDEGDEVITTALTFVATLNTIVLAGGRPVLVDVHPDTLNMDVSQLERAITPRTKAIMPVHFAGLPVDLNPLYALADKHGLRVVEDCAHAIGAAYDGSRIGAFGDIQVMSFHPTKNITTGEGGAIITDDDPLIERVECLRFHGIDRSAFNRFAKDGSQQYDVVVPGHKFNMMDIQAALGIHQLPLLDGFVDQRDKLAARYLEKLKGVEGLRLPVPARDEDRHAWHLFTIRIEDNPAGLDRDGFMQAMNANNIGTGLHYQAVTAFRWYQDRYGWKPEDFPHALDAGKRICSLPLFPTLGFDEQDRVIDTIRAVLNGGNAPLKLEA